MRERHLDPTFMKRVWARVRRKVRDRAAAEDVIQAAFLRAEEYCSKKGEPDSYEGLLWKNLKWAVADYYRKKAGLRERTTRDVCMLMMAGQVPNADAAITWRETALEIPQTRLEAWALVWWEAAPRDVALAAGAELSTLYGARSALAGRVKTAGRRLKWRR